VARAKFLRDFRSSGVVANKNNFNLRRELTELDVFGLTSIRPFEN